MNKIASIILIIFLVVISSITIVTMVLLINNGFDFGSFFNFHMDLVDTYEIEADKINELNVKFSSSEIEVQRGTGKLKVEYYSNKDIKPLFKNEKNSLTVEKDEKNQCHFFCINRSKLIVYLPDEYDGTINVNTNSGSVNFETDYTNNNININVHSGSVHLKAVKQIDVNSSSGSIKVDKVLENANITVSSGSIKVGETNTGSIQASSGSIKIGTINDSANIKASSGSISIDNFYIKNNSTIEAKSGSVKVNHTDNCYIEGEANSGSVNINNSDRKSNIELKVKTSSGSIRIN